MTRVLSVPLLIAVWAVADAATPSAVLLAATALVLAGLVALAARHAVPYAARTPHVPTAVRSGGMIFVALRDPDGPGRPRPRAPSAYPGAA